MDEEKKKKEIEEDSKTKIKSSEKVLEKYKKQLQVISPQYNKAIEQATNSIRMMDISNKIELAKPKILSSNEQIINTINSNM